MNHRILYHLQKARVAMQCPFLNRVPVPLLRQHGRQVLRYADNCPVMTHLHPSLRSFSDVANEDGNHHGEFL